MKLNLIGKPTNDERLASSDANMSFATSPNNVLVTESESVLRMARVLLGDVLLYILQVPFVFLDRLVVDFRVRPAFICPVLFSNVIVKLEKRFFI